MQIARTFAYSSLLAAAFALPVAFSAVARAEGTCGDKTCPQNYECVTSPAPCPDIACAPDDPSCMLPACEGTYQECSPLPCTLAAQCASGMTCYVETREDCPSAPPCAKGADCAAPADTACTTTTVSGCVPIYVLPCESDVDCGAGFTCDVEQECACSGSSGSSGSGGTPSNSGGGEDAGTPTPTPAADPPSAGCTCTPGDHKVCNMKSIACSVDEGCLPGWTCGDNPNGSCWAKSDGTSGCDADPPKVCLPPYYGSIGGGPHADDSGVVKSPPRGDSGGTGTAGSSSTGESPSTPPVADAAGEPGDTLSPNGSGGCSMAAPRNGVGTTFGFAGLVLAGLLGMRRRRAGF